MFQIHNGKSSTKSDCKKFVAEVDIKPRSAESSLIPLMGAFFPFHCHELEFIKVGILQSAVLGDSTCHDLHALAVICQLKLKDKKWDGSCV